MTRNEAISSASQQDPIALTRRTFLAAGGALALLVTGGQQPAQAASPAFYAGANLSGLESKSSAQPGVPNTDYYVPTTGELDYLKLRGITTVRLPFNWKRLQPNLGGVLDVTYLGFLTALVDHAGSQGQKIILDVHTYGAHGADKIGSNGVTVEHFADLWGKLAAEFDGRAGVGGYDLMNEPSNMPGPDVWPAAAQAAVDAIRAVDTSTQILCEGDNWSSAASWVAVNGNLKIDDPADNLVYSAHVYFDRDSSGTHYDWDTEVAAGDTLRNPPGPLTIDIGVQRITGFADWCRQHGHVGQIGEVAAANTAPQWLSTLDRLLSFCRTRKIGVTYWSAGNWFRNYPYGIAQQLDGRDTVQMAVLEKYTGAPAPKDVYLSGPARGPARALSTAFTADYRGYHASPLTLTPTDHGAGGVFRPATLTMPAGFNGLASFQYKAPGTASYRIGLTNASGLNNPQALGYSTRSDAYSTIDPASILNVLATRRLYSPYAGPALTLRRDSDGATEAFGYTADDALDAVTIQAWAGTSAISVVKLNDQGPGARHAGPVVTKNEQGPGGAVLPSSAADHPRLVLDGLNGEPVLRFDRSRMDALSPIDGLTGFTCFTVVRPGSVKAMSRLLSWHMTQFLLIAGGTSNDPGKLQITGEPLLPMGVDPSAWHIYAVRWSGGGTLSTYLDGAQVATATAQTPRLTFQHEKYVNIGYFRWAPNVFFAGDVWAMLPFSTALTQPQMDGLWEGLSAATGISVQI